MDCLGKNHTSDLLEIKNEITKSNQIIAEKNEAFEEYEQGISQEKWDGGYLKIILKFTKELQELRELSHPGFIIGFDNIDQQLQRKNMTLSAQNRSYHWVNHKMITNRVSGCDLPSENPKSDIVEVPNIKFFPSYKDHQQQHLDYGILVSRILVEYFDEFKQLKAVCIQHIPHKHTSEMSKKSSKVKL